MSVGANMTPHRASTGGSPPEPSRDRDDAGAAASDGAALTWVDVCALDDIWPSSGVAALLGGK